MRISWRLWLRVGLVVIAAALLWVRLVPHRRATKATTAAIPDLSKTSPLNAPGGGPAPAEAYAVYSGLYQSPVQEPLVFAENSVIDIPQVGGSCLKPSTSDEHQMADAFVAANQQSHEWEPKFSIPQSYQVLPHNEVLQVQGCLQSHGKGAGCEKYQQIRHVRFLGVPGFNHDHTRALVSIIKNCGGFCGTGGIFAVEKKGGTWQRSPMTDFTSDCSWMY